MPARWRDPRLALGLLTTLNLLVVFWWLAMRTRIIRALFVHLWVDRARRKVYFQDVDVG